MEFLETPDGRLGSTLLGPGGVSVPLNVVLNAEDLCFDWGGRVRNVCDPNSQREPTPPVEMKHIPVDIYKNFIDLLPDGESETAAGNNRILEFARKWGPLSPWRIASQPIQTWRKYIELAKAMLLVAIDLKREERGEWNGKDVGEHWLVVAGSYLDPGLREGMPAEVGPALLAGAVNMWYEGIWGHETFPLTDWSKDPKVKFYEIRAIRDVHYIAWPVRSGIEIRPYSKSLPGAIIIQLAYAMASMDERPQVFCTHCKAPFPLTKWKPTAPRRFCEECRKNKIPGMLASRKYRKEKKKEEEEKKRKKKRKSKS